MMDFIKKNIALTIVIIVTILISGYLTYLFLEEIKSYDKEKAVLNQAVNTANTLKNAKIAPSEENLRSITRNEAKIKSLLNDVHVYFGHPYKKAENKFRKILETKIKDFDYNKYIEAVKEAWITDVATISEGDKFLKINDSFTKETNNFAPIPKEILIQALKAFEIQYDRLSLGVKMKDYQSLTSRIPFFLDTIGIERTMLQTTSRRYINKQQNLILSYLDKKDCYYDISLNQFFSFDFNTQQMLSPKTIPIYIKQLDISYDLLKRIADSSITRLESYNAASLHPAKSGKFEIYRYNINFISSLESLRKVLKSLNQGYKSNRIYSIQTLAINRVNDNKSTAAYYLGLTNRLKALAVGKLQDELGEDLYETKGFYTYPNVKASRTSKMDSSMSGPEYQDEGSYRGREGEYRGREDEYSPRAEGSVTEKEKSEEQLAIQAELEAKKKATPIDKFPGYGELVIGTSRDVKVSLIVDYTIYAGDKIQNNVK